MAKQLVALLVLMGVADIEQPGECGHIQHMVAGDVELQRLAADVEIRRGDALVAEGLAQVIERLAERAPRGSFGALGPQQPDQGLAAVGVIRFDRQIDQQGPHFVRIEGRDGGAIQAHLNGAEQAQRQARHGGSLGKVLSNKLDAIISLSRKTGNGHDRSMIAG